MEELINFEGKICQRCHRFYKNDDKAWNYRTMPYSGSPILNRPVYCNTTICVHCFVYLYAEQSLLQSLRMDPLIKMLKIDYSEVITPEFVYPKIVLRAIYSILVLEYGIKSISSSPISENSILYTNLNLIMENLPMPTNNKSIFSTLCKTLQMLVNNEMTPEQGNTIAKVASQTNNSLTYELKRAALMTNQEFKKEHRNIEIKSFTQIEGK